MNRLDTLLESWDSRSEAEEQSLSSENRERVARMFLELARDKEGNKVVNKQLLSVRSSELADFAANDNVSVSALCAELRSCQISLLDVMVRHHLEQSGRADTARVLSDTMSVIESLVEGGVRQLKAHHERKSENGEENAGKAKSLQHEIRTPLQGALLTTELMLEDAQKGDVVQEDDISAVRRSIETAVRILNEFAAAPRSSTRE